MKLLQRLGFLGSLLSELVAPSPRGGALLEVNVPSGLLGYSDRGPTRKWCPKSQVLGNSSKPESEGCSLPKIEKPYCGGVSHLFKRCDFRDHSSPQLLWHYWFQHAMLPSSLWIEGGFCPDWRHDLFLHSTSLLGKWGGGGWGTAAEGLDRLFSGHRKAVLVIYWAI